MLLILLAMSLAGCAAAGTRSADVSARPDASAPRVATMYRSPTCSCCHEYEAILERNGWTIDVVESEDMGAFKMGHGVPREAWSCHTMMVDGYAVEGHVPLAAIDDLLARRPAIDGIALPGMPAGSPGMSGVAEGPFVVLTLQDGKTSPFGSY